jgi:signal transduction histidine kinase
MTAYAGPSDTDDLSIQADRERIARDLHDSVVQRLFAIGLAMQGTASLAQRPEVAERLQQHVDDIDDTIREIRSVIFALGIDHMPRSSPRRQVFGLVAASAR